VLPIRPVCPLISECLRTCQRSSSGPIRELQVLACFWLPGRELWRHAQIPRDKNGPTTNTTALQPGVRENILRAMQNWKTYIRNERSWLDLGSATQDPDANNFRGTSLKRNYIWGYCSTEYHPRELAAGAAKNYWWSWGPPAAVCRRSHEV
jgi:hypothetical protein